ncbi:MAG: hypothetical protein AAF467_17390 [Actinomycetota bacterium]
MSENGVSDDQAAEATADAVVEPSEADGASSAAGDVLPEDLQPHLVDPEDYVFPNNNRRRIPGYLYLGIAIALTVLVITVDGSVFVNRGLLGAAAILGVVGVYSIVTGWNLNIDERDALVAAVAEVGFPVGHASAQMGWRGLLSRPTWRILLYSADEPPAKRGFVMVDGVDGAVVDSFVEDNPEDWSIYDDEEPPSDTAPTGESASASTESDAADATAEASEPAERDAAT